MITKNLVAKKPLLWGAIFASSLVLTACSSNDNDGSNPLNGGGDSVPVTPTDDNQNTPSAPTGLIVSVSAADVDADYYVGSPPQAVGSLVLNPLSVEEGAVSVISGGSQILPIASDQEFSSIYVLSDDDGYFVVSLPENTFSTEVIISYNPVVVDQQMAQLDVAVGSSEGSVSAPQSLELQTVQVGTGDVQASISWDQPNDVDLYLVEPDGTIIFFNELTSASGGELDLDSNPACNLDYVNNENITYENATPPSGEYIVGVSLYAACSVTAPTSYVVTVRNGGTVNTFRGVLMPEEEQADIREVTRFIVN